MNVKNRAVIRRLSFKTLWASRKRNLIAIVAIALTALLFTSLFTVVMSLNSSYEMYLFRQIGGYSHGSFKDVTEEQAQAIAAHPKVKTVGERTVIGSVYSGVFAKVPAEVSFMDENCTDWSFAQPTTGHMPQSGKEITMDTAALRLLGVQPELGTKVTLTYTVGDKDQTAYEKTDTFTLVGWWDYDDIGPVHYINVSQDYADQIEAEAVAAGMESFRTDLNVMMASGVDIRGQMEQVDLDLGYSWDEAAEGEAVRIGVNWGYTTEQLGDSMDTGMVVAIVAFLALVMFTGYLIIYNIFRISVAGDIRFYGLLKTIGTTPRQLRRIIRQQALLLCAAGIPVGLLLGYGVGVGVTPVVMGNTNLGAEATVISASPWIFLASALFALLTVLLSCSRPGRIAAKVSPVEATKYTEVIPAKKKRRTTRGAKIHQMAFANLGRNKSKTVLVVISLALSVVLLNVLVMFTGGFDMEKFLAQKTCADFIVSSTDYFRFVSHQESYIDQSAIDEIAANTTQSLSGCGYTLVGCSPIGWMPEDTLRMDLSQYVPDEGVEADLSMRARKGDSVSYDAMIEGLDESLFEKLTVVKGDLTPLFQKGSNAIAVAVDTDDYGNIVNPDNYPPIGSTQTVTYAEDVYYIDSRTGEKCDENTPEEFLQEHIEARKEVDYTICAYVIIPYSMSYRYRTAGYEFVLPADRLEKDSQQTMIPMVYVFDTPDAASEEAAEQYLSQLTAGDLSPLMYESKAALRAEFESFRQMFLLLGGMLCAIIGIVGILNFFNAIMTGILSRQREFAVLQAVGMTNRQLKRMLVLEGLLYTLGSSVIALVLSIAANPLVGNLLENMFWFFSAKFTIIPVLIIIPVFALLGYLIPFMMSGQSTKYSIVERLRRTE